MECYQEGTEPTICPWCGADGCWTIIPRTGGDPWVEQDCQACDYSCAVLQTPDEEA